MVLLKLGPVGDHFERTESAPVGRSTHVRRPADLTACSSALRSEVEGTRAAHSRLGAARVYDWPGERPSFVE